MKIDIAICTWNRSRNLSETLYSIGRAAIPDGTSVRIIVVDNNSTDDTVACVRSFDAHIKECSNRRGRLSLTLEHETKQGHTHSRNCAIAVADGDLILWTDDDVIVDPNWITSYVNASTDFDESFWGGKITPSFEQKIPDWIEQNWQTLKGCFAERDLGPKHIALDRDHLPYGANFAIRTDVQKQYLFNVNLGRRNHDILGGDEIEMFTRLLKAGFRGSWIPESSLLHRIGPERASESYVRNYFVGQGQILKAKGATWSTNRRRLYWLSVFEFTAYRFKRNWAKSPAWVAHLVRSGLAEGQLLECQTK